MASPCRQLRRRASRLAILLLLGLGLAGSSFAQSKANSRPARLRARISTTSYGVVHVQAADLAGVGFGHGYALAVSDICTVADRWVTVRAERSRFFGVEGAREGWQTVTNLQSDFYWQRLIDSDLVGKELSHPPPMGPIPEVRELVRGYVAGYNYYLQQTGAARIPDPRCRGKPWVRPITERDVYLRAFLTVGFCGGYPTFSTFSYEAVALLEDGEWTRASLYIALSLGLSLFATFLGFAAARELGVIRGRV